MAKNVSIVKEKEQELDIYKPTETEISVLESVFSKFRDSADDRNRSFAYFDYLTLVEYIEDSVLRFTTNIDERDDIEDWQSRINTQFTRNKVLAVLGKVVQVLPIANFSARGDEDYRRACILNDLYEYSEDVDDYEELMTHVVLEAIVKGTAIGYEGLQHKERTLKTVKSVEDKITFVEDKEITNKLYGSIIPLEDFYPQHVGFRNIKSMDYCFWRTTMPYHSFISQFGGYEMSKWVQPKKTYDKDETRPYYADFISPDVSDGEVEIIRYYNKDTDEYIITANHVWLNPLMMDGNKVVSPLPFNHKELPFWDIRFDFFGPDFFYGKSLPDRLKTMQDVLNVLTNMLLDQSFLTIFPPLLTAGFDSIEDDYIRPGRRTPVDTQGSPLSQSFMLLDQGTPNGWHQYILEYTKRIMEESSLDQVSSGQAGVGGRTTAQEIRLAAEGVASMLGMFGRVINFGLKRKAKLRGSNIMQFWTDSNSPYFEKILGGDGAKEASKAFSTFKIDNAQLTDGKRGTKIIEFYQNPDDRPTRKEMKARKSIYESTTNKKIEIVAIDPEYLRSFDFDIAIIPNAKKEVTKDLEKALQLEKVRVYLSFFPEIVDKTELAIQTAEKMGDDPTKVFKQDIFNPQPQKNGEAVTPMSTEPEGAEANNMLRGAQGGEQDAMQMRDLQNSMIG